MERMLRGPLVCQADTTATHPKESVIALLVNNIMMNSARRSTLFRIVTSLDFSPRA